MIKTLQLTGKLLLIVVVISFASCKKTKEASRTTGWNYNDPNMGGFEVADYKQPVTGPGLVFIEGGTFTMGRVTDDPMYDWNNIPRRVTVTSFYMDETEVTNVDYCEYLYWTNKVYGQSYPRVYQKALPDTLVWREKLAYNEPLIETYLRHPAYKNYPVVGVTWLQANDYCLWRTDRVNEFLLMKKGVIKIDPKQKNDNNFNTEAYLAGQYKAMVNKGMKNLDPNGKGDRNARFEDGIMLPKYRLPTEAEWEYAAYGLRENTDHERITERKIYPWNGTSLRFQGKRYRGAFMANFKRGRGDMMGVAGQLNDGAEIPAEVTKYWPNDYGLYNMAGNVAEWVQDVYRQLSFEDVDDFSPFRGNIFKTRVTDSATGRLVKKDSLGHIKYRNVTEAEAEARFNYRRADNINYKDGDIQTLLGTNWAENENDPEATAKMYEYGITSLVSDKSRVVKGGSWRDPAFYLSPSARRFMDEDKSTNYIGFRCAMGKLGPSDNSGSKKSKKSKKK